MKIEFVTSLGDYGSDIRTKAILKILQNNMSSGLCKENVGYVRKNIDNSAFEHRTNWNLL